MRVSPDGRTIATAGLDGVRLWNVATREQGPVITVRGLVRGIAFTPDNRSLAVASTEDGVRLFDVATGTRTATVSDYGGAAWALEISADGNKLAVAEVNGRVWVRDLRAGEKFWMAVEKFPFVGIRFSADSRTLGVVRQDSVVRKWDPVSDVQSTVGQPGAQFFVARASLSPDLTTMASAGVDGTLKVWELGTGEETTLPWTGEIARELAYSPDSRTLVTAHGPGTVVLWDVPGRTVLAELTTFGGTVNSVGFSPDSRTLATVDDVGLLRLWNLDAEEVIGDLCRFVHDNPVPDGDATACE